MEIIHPISEQPIPENAKKVFSWKLFDVYQWEQELFDFNMMGCKPLPSR